ncbi:hypothetical protein [Serratia marcescens]|uniref:hypothetical protein n=1 Tax=Serratia marcescens TaxID=615 RepID=UPI003D02E104
MNLPAAVEVLPGGVLALSQAGSDGTPDTFKVTVTQLAAAMPQGETGGGGGVTSVVVDGVMPSGYNPDLSGDKARINFTGCECWKTTVTLDNAPEGGRPPVHCALKGVPCNANGDPLPYNLYTTYVSAAGRPRLVIVLAVYGTAALAKNFLNGRDAPLGLVSGTYYPPQFTLTYWY